MSGTSSPSEPGANGSVLCGVSLPFAAVLTSCGEFPQLVPAPAVFASVVLRICSSATMRPLSCDCLLHSILPNGVVATERNVAAPQKAAKVGDLVVMDVKFYSQKRLAGVEGQSTNAKPQVSEVWLDRLLWDCHFGYRISAPLIAGGAMRARGTDVLGARRALGCRTTASGRAQ